MTVPVSANDLYRAAPEMVWTGADAACHAAEFVPDAISDYDAMRANERVEVRVVGDVDYDDRRGWELATVWLDGKSVMVTQRAGREMRDYRNHWVTDPDAYRDLALYLISLAPDPYIDPDNVIDPDAPNADLADFYSDTLERVRERDLQPSDTSGIPGSVYLPGRDPRAVNRLLRHTLNILLRERPDRQRQIGTVAALFDAAGDARVELSELERHWVATGLREAARFDKLDEYPTLSIDDHRHIAKIAAEISVARPRGARRGRLVTYPGIELLYYGPHGQRHLEPTEHTAPRRAMTTSAAADIDVRGPGEDDSVVETPEID